MNLISVQFIAFCVLTVVVYFAMPKRYRWIVLLAASLWFYYGIGKRALVTILAVSLFVFASGIWIESSLHSGKKRRLLLALSVVVIVGWLVITKISAAQEWDYYLIVVPLGVSYVTFSLISYLADIYWERDKADRNFLKFLLYVFFFPKISQGPISRHNLLACQLYDGGCLSYENICFGCQRAVYGFFKKIVIADRISIITNVVFSNIGGYSGSVVAVATVLAACELYCDFSGYMDISIGLCEMLGIELDENFKHPFFSHSAAEFWRRWHITLGTWFKDYIYTPIIMSGVVKRLGKWGRKKVSKRFGNSVTKIIALAVVWFLTGLWHGTGANYIIWGLMWGGIIIFSTIFSEEIEKVNKLLHMNTQALSWSVFQMIRTFMIFCMGIMITRLNSLSEIKIAIWSIFRNFNMGDILAGKIYELGVDRFDFRIICFGLLTVLCVSLIQERCSVRQKIAELNEPVRWFIYATGISIVLFFGIYGTEYSTSGFAYMYF